MTDYKETIIKELDVLRRISASEPAGVFKARQYTAAIKTLKELPYVRSMDNLPPPTEKKTGLGGRIRDTIQRIMTDGTLGISDERREVADSLELFRGIYGIGPKKAEELITAGYKTVADLRAAAAANTKLFTRNQHLGLAYYEQLLERIPRAEMDRHAAALMSALPAELEGVIVGSYRRGRSDSGDIDMLLRVKRPTTLASYVNTLIRTGYIKEVLAQGAHKCMAISKVEEGTAARRLDLLITPHNEFPFAVFYFTGSDTFNVRVRQHALTLGFTLNEHALTSVATKEPVEGIITERDIFDALGIEWKEPAERTGADAVVLKA